MLLLAVADEHAGQAFPPEPRDGWRPAVLVFAAFYLALGFPCFYYLGLGFGALTWGLLLLQGVMFVCLTAYLSTCYRPCCYRVNPEGITVGMRWETVHLAADQLASVERFDKRGILWKTFGYQSGALRWGRFWSRQLGKVRAYTAGRAPLVLVRLHGQPPVLFSPGDTAGFLEAVQRIIEDRDTKDPA